MRQAITIDVADGKFILACPYWANELVQTHLPNRRWSKPKRHWYAPILRMSVEGVVKLGEMEGVTVTDAARAAIAEYTKAKAGTRASQGAGFPSWYKFKTKLRRSDGSGVDEFKPYKHAINVLNKKWGKPSFAVHHDMGTAKTRTEIDYMCALRMEGKIDAALILVKLSGRRNWLEQLNGPMTIGGIEYAEGWAPIPVDVLLPTTDERGRFRAWNGTPHDFKVMVVGLESMSQGRMPELVAEFLQGRRLFGLIDESHLIANHKSIRSEAVYKLRPAIDYRDTATGTPIGGDPLDLYGQFEWLDPEIIGIGDFYAFRNRYAVVVETKTKAGKKFPLVVGYQNMDELTKTLAPYTDEVRKKDVLDLPPKNYLPHVYVQPTKEQAALLKRIKEEGAYPIRKAPGEQVIQNVLELELRLHQVAQGFMPEYTEEAYIGRKGDDRIRRTAEWHAIVAPKRNPKIVELIDIVRADRQFIIWASYRPVLGAIVDQLMDAYPKESIVQIHGGISENDRATYRAEYQKGKHKFMVGNTQTGGTADTWTACETMIYFDNTNKMIDRAQSEDRAHRGGLKHPVDYIDLIMEGTPDVVRMKAVIQKLDLSEYVRLNIRRWSDLLEGK